MYVGNIYSLFYIILHTYLKVYILYIGSRNLPIYYTLVGRNLQKEKNMKKYLRDSFNATRFLVV